MLYELCDLAKPKPRAASSILPTLRREREEWALISWLRLGCVSEIYRLGYPACSISLLHEVHVTVPLQEFEIAHPVKIILRAEFHFRVLDDLG
jgi:hypothetical protein